MEGCPVEAVMGPGNRYPCTYRKGHDGPHSYLDARPAAGDAGPEEVSSAYVATVGGFCGAELLPHAIAGDGSPAPIICTLPPHPPGTWHSNDDRGTRWRPQGE